MNLTLLLSLLLVGYASGSESSLTVTYQPLDGLGSGGIRISQVTCHDWYSQSGQATQIDLISARNVPPTNNPKQATADLNLASMCGIRFYASDIGDPKTPLELKLAATKLLIPENRVHQQDEIIRASLECLRRCLPDQLLKTPVTLEASNADREWMTKIIIELNAHDRAKGFFTPRS